MSRAPASVPYFDRNIIFSQPPGKMYSNAIYYPNWRIYRNQPPVSLNFDVISHAFYAFAWLDQLPASVITLLTSAGSNRMEPSMYFSVILSNEYSTDLSSLAMNGQTLRSKYQVRRVCQKQQAV